MNAGFYGPPGIAVVPLPMGEELLQALCAGSGDSSGHSVTVFIGQFRKQADQIALQGGLAL